MVLYSVAFTWIQNRVVYQRWAFVTLYNTRAGQTLPTINRRRLVPGMCVDLIVYSGEYRGNTLQWQRSQTDQNQQRCRPVSCRSEPEN